MRPSYRKALAFVAALAAAPLGPAVWAPVARADDAPAGISIDALLARFRKIPGLSAHFREEKHIALLAKPIVNEGTIHYAPTARLARHTLSPSVSSVLLDNGTLRFGDGTKEETIDIDASPLVRAIVDGFLQLLAGDRGALEKSFSLEQKAASGDRWDIVLHPKSDQLAHIIREMELSGNGVVVDRLRIAEASGDEAITTFSNVDANHTYAPAEAAQVFRLPSSSPKK